MRGIKKVNISGSGFTNWDVKSLLTKLHPPRQRLTLTSKLMTNVLQLKLNKENSSLVVSCSGGEQVNFVSPPLRMCHSPVEQKWNSTSAIIEQQGAEEVFQLERRNKWEEWAKMSGEGEKLGND